MSERLVRDFVFGGRFRLRETGAGTGQGPANTETPLPLQFSCCFISTCEAERKLAESLQDAERLRADKTKFEAPAEFVLARGAQRGGVGVVACRLGAGCRVHASLVLDS